MSWVSPYYYSRAMVRPIPRLTPVTMPTIRSKTSPIMRSYLLVWPWVPRGDVPAEEVAHEPSDQVPFAFQREVAGVEQVELDRLEVALVRLGPGRRKDLVVGAPHNQHRRLVLPEIVLPLRVERRVTPVAQKQVELDLVVVLAIQQILVSGPAVRRDELGTRDAVGVLPAGGLDVEEGLQCGPLLQAGRVLPVRLEGLPEVVVQSLVVGVAVLHHDGGDAVRVAGREPVADRRAVILHVEGVLRQAEYRGELLDDGGEVIEGVSELVPRRHRAVAEAGVVGGEHAVAVGQGRDQVAEHLRAGREAVQQEYCRRVLWPGLAVEDVQVTDLDRPVRHSRRLDHGISWVRVRGGRRHRPFT